MDSARLQQMSDEVARLMAERLRLRGQTLPQLTRAAGRLLPRRLRAEARRLIEAQALAAHPKLSRDPHFSDHLLFHEYFHGDTGRGCGASHQTGWTGLITKILMPRRTLD